MSWIVDAAIIIAVTAVIWIDALLWRRDVRVQMQKQMNEAYSTGYWRGYHARPDGANDQARAARKAGGG